MIPKTHHSESQSEIRGTTPNESNPGNLRLITSAAPTPGGKYQVRVGNQLFRGDDTRHLLRLAVQARLAQNRVPTEQSF